MVATSQPLASLVGIETLKKGGNAVDAAIAIAAMVNVCEPMMTGIGGDLFAMVYWHKTKTLQGLNASGIQPRQLSLDYFASRGMRTIPQAGFESMNIPGAFDGWVALHEKYGSQPFASLLEPAIHYAQHGFTVAEKAAQFWEYGASKLRLQQDSIEAYLIKGKAPRPGELFRQPDLASTLKFLGKEGRDAFYNGPIAKQIVAYCPLLELEDFKAQKSDWTETISINYRGFEIHEMPPNGQGLVALEALKILEGFDLSAMNPVAYEHYIIEALKLSFADGHRYIADPRFVKVPVHELLSESFIQKRRKEIVANKALPLVHPGKIAGDTTYFTVIDEHKNAVSFIMSLSDLFGSGIVPKGTGIVLNNRGSELSLDPNHPNVVKPHKRPYHSIIPAMVFKQGELFMSFGCMGGNMQPQGHVQILSNLIDRKMPLQEALSSPRIRVLEENRVALEETLDPAIIDGLLHLGHERVTGESIPDDWSLPHIFARSFKGGAQAIMVDPMSHTLTGASDSRLDGIPIGY
jgi:gamma-glutamyltranspeptidase / glutathione hydrolase